MTDKLNDAEFFGKVDDSILARTITIGLGKSADQKHDAWRNQQMTVQQLIEMLSIHKEGTKDGTCYLQSEVIGGLRRAASIKKLDLMVLDLDTGEDVDAVCDQIQDQGLFCVVYSTHSHMKAITEIKKSALAKFIGDDEREPTLDDARAYLLKVKNYTPSILDGAVWLGTEHVKDGVMVRVRHQEMPKFRLVFLLDEPFVIMDRHPNPAASIQEWKERYTGLSRMIGAHFDRSCVDPSRLFYMPRHPKGETRYFVGVLAGKMLHIDDVPRVTKEDLRREEEDPFALEAEDVKTYKTAGLAKFAAKYADRFNIVDFLEAKGVEYRGIGSQGGAIVKCPNDDQHSDAGNPDDKGCWAKSSEGEGFIFTCQHTACKGAGLDRLDLLDLQCQECEPPVTEAADLREWVDRLEGEDDDMGWTEKPLTKEEEAVVAVAGGYADAASAFSEIESLTDKSRWGEICRKIGRSNFAGEIIGDLRKALHAKSGATITDINREIKKGTAARRKVTLASSRDDPDDPELKKINDEYAVVNAGNEVRVMRAPIGFVGAPRLLAAEGFRVLLGNNLIVEEDAEGKTKIVSMAKKWLEWPHRRTYNGIVFEPEWDRARSEEEQVFNIWHGFPVHPKPGNWDLLHTHIHDNICQKNHDYYVWLMTWIAQIFQQPGTKLGSAVAIRGKKGVGKSKLFDWIRMAMGSHSIKVSQRSHITGNFNAHMGHCVLMVCEEAFWAGDNQSGGVLKDLITSDKTMLEKKGVDTIEVSNYVRLAMISNENWVVPAGFDDERRFLVLECGQDHIGDRNYFHAIDEQMRRGGLEAMMDFFMKWEPGEYEIGSYGPVEQMSWGRLRTPPHTPWLTDQAVETLDITEKFFLMGAMYGFLGAEGRDVPPIILHPDQRITVKINELLYHYNEFIMHGYGGRQYAGNVPHMIKLATKWLLADEFVAQHPDGSVSLELGSRNAVRMTLASRGVESSKYVNVLTNVNEIGENVPVVTVDGGQVARVAS